MPPARLDRFAESRGAAVLAFTWGWAEASFLFLVPDVLLTLSACRSLRRAAHLAVLALAGAIMGGAMMYGCGARSPERARSFLSAVPGIDSALLDRVRSQIDRHGLTSVMIGPARGIPYKIYAVEWGARRGGLAVFLLVSVPARLLRFFLTALIARATATALAGWTRRRPAVELALWGAAWTAFYAVYFSLMGW